MACERREADEHIDRARRAGLHRLLGLAALAMIAPRTTARDATAPALPDWVPPPGSIASISLNTLASLDPCPLFPCTWSGTVGQRGVFAYSGGAYARDCGPYGAYVMTGGGHGDYHGNEVYLFALHERKWRRLSEPYPSNGLGRGRERGAPAAARAELQRYWPTFDPLYGDYDGATPEQMHTYDFIDVLPADAGGGPQGSLIRLIGTACGRAAYNFRGTHVCDLASGRWSRYALCDASGVAGGGAYDAKRKRFYLLVAPASSPSEHVFHLDTGTRRWTRTHTASPVQLSIESSANMYPPADLLLYVQGFAHRAPVVWALPLAGAGAARWTRLSTTGPAPVRANGSSRGLGLEFCPLDGALYCVPGGKQTQLWKLTPPRMEALTGTWTWSAEQLEGQVSARGGGMTYNRLRWADPVRSLIWVDGIRGDVQLVRPHAAG
jgi:hypothetical protein